MMKTSGMDSQTKEDSDGREDFNFLIGKWEVHNRRLVKRLDNCSDWQEFPATLKVHSILGGLGNFDEFSADYPDGKPLEGTTVRIFNPKAQTWSLHWVDNRTCQLQASIVGRFAGNRGEFFGDETFDGKPIRVRFVWVKTTPLSAHWEQAFSVDAGKTWETNWEMDFVRQE